MPTREINLTEHFDQFIEDQMQSGKYQTASEVCCEALHLLEQQKSSDADKLQALRSAIAEGNLQFEQGKTIHLENEEALQSLISQIGQKAAQKSHEAMEISNYL